MIAELRNIISQIKVFEREVENFMLKAEEVRDKNVELSKENEQLKARLAELESKQE